VDGSVIKISKINVGKINKKEGDKEIKAKDHKNRK
jgi:mannose/fructose/N-acetylgalactosamine-specific phosphotransferase system component IIB